MLNVYRNFIKISIIDTNISCSHRPYTKYTSHLLFLPHLEHEKYTDIYKYNIIVRKQSNYVMADME